MCRPTEDEINNSDPYEPNKPSYSASLNSLDHPKQRVERPIPNKPNVEIIQIAVVIAEHCRNGLSKVCRAPTFGLDNDSPALGLMKETLAEG